MKELAEEEPHLVEQFQKLSEAAGRVGKEEKQWNIWTNLWVIVLDNTKIFCKRMTVIMIPLPWDGEEMEGKKETLFNERGEIGWKVTEKIIEKW